jgi:hypothetical protein
MVKKLAKNQNKKWKNAIAHFALRQRHVLGSVEIGDYCPVCEIRLLRKLTSTPPSLPRGEGRIGATD